MKALSIRQPWAWLVVHGPKRIENRSWHLPPSMVGQRIYIHAAAGMTYDEYFDAVSMAREIARYTLLTVGARGEPVHVEHVPDLAELADARIVVGNGTAVVA